MNRFTARPFAGRRRPRPGRAARRRLRLQRRRGPPGAKKMAFKLTDAGCEPHNAKAPAGPINFEVENAGTSSVTELEVLDGETILGEVENLSDGPLRQLLADPREGRIHAALPRRRRRRRHPDRHRRRQARGQPRGRSRDRPVPRIPRGKHRRAGRRDRAVRRRGRSRRSRRGEGALPGGPHPLRADRAGGRVLRRPRPPHRRP